MSSAELQREYGLLSPSSQVQSWDALSVCRLGLVKFPYEFTVQARNNFKVLQDWKIASKVLSVSKTRRRVHI
jgi:hypothetical protein